LVAPGTGVLLNDEMDDFAAQPGVPNVYGLVGGEANAIAPGRRMLSSMSPTFLESEQDIAILGTPGGSRIISMVLQGLLAVTEGAPVTDWVTRPRIHHQFLPDRIQFEPDALSAADQAALATKGHRLDPLHQPFGNMQTIFMGPRARAGGSRERPARHRQRMGRVAATGCTSRSAPARVVTRGNGFRPRRGLVCLIWKQQKKKP
jgi:gamma-glutamyltranspeptidase/glutathione hydrolase